MFCLHVTGESAGWDGGIQEDEPFEPIMRDRLTATGEASWVFHLSGLFLSVNVSFFLLLFIYLWCGQHASAHMWISVDNLAEIGSPSIKEVLSGDQTQIIRFGALTHRAILLTCHPFLLCSPSSCLRICSVWTSL